MLEIKTLYEWLDVKNYLYTRKELESFSTERLVNFIHHNQLYRHDDYMMSPDNLDLHEKGIIEVEADWNDSEIRAYYWAVEEELREILKNRPNIPNKQQKKKILKDTIAENKKKTKRNLKYQR